MYCPLIYMCYVIMRLKTVVIFFKVLLLFIVLNVKFLHKLRSS